jgi:predicted ATPase
LLLHLLELASVFSLVRDLLRERNKGTKEGTKEGRARAVGNSFFLLL